MRFGSCIISKMALSPIPSLLHVIHVHLHAQWSNARAAEHNTDETLTATSQGHHAANPCSPALTQRAAQSLAIFRLPRSERCGHWYGWRWRLAGWP